MINIFIRLWGHVLKRRKIQFILFLILTVIGSLVEVVSLGAIIPFLAALSNPEKMLTFPIISDILIHFNVTKPQQIMLLLTVFFASAAVIAGSIRLLILYLSPKLAFMTAHDLGVKIYRLILYQTYEKHLEKSTSEIIAGITAKTYAVSGVLQAGINFINSLALIIFISTGLVLLDPYIAIISALGFGGVYLIVTFIVRKRLNVNSEHIGKETTQTIRALQEGLNGIRDIILDSSQRFYSNIYNTSDLKLRRAQSSNMFIQGSPRNIVETLGMVIIAGVALSLSNTKGGIVDSLPLLGALALGAQRLLPALQQVFATWSLIAGYKRPVIDVLELLSQPEPLTHKHLKYKSMFFEKSIELKNVSFRYASNNETVLFDVNLSFLKGSKIAFVGPTGGGKSTVIDLIMGLLKPSEGKIIIDGEVLNSDYCDKWQSQIAHVPQKIHLMDATIAENVALGIPTDQINHKLLKDVIKQSQLFDFINNSSNGYNSKVGESGKALSGGQIQRIGIARALYKQANVLVFDEATSALDTMTEQKVMSSISQSNKDITIILVTHRLSTVKDCDIIFELESGRIIAQGSYNQLLQSSKAFKKMVEA